MESHIAGMNHRYSRQQRYKHIGDKGQRLLGESRVAVVGMGALGSVIAQHLVRSGAGYMRLIDRDFIEWSNLQRQMLYNEQDVRQLLPKAVAAANHLRQVNSSIAIEPVIADMTSYNANELLADVDLIVDGTDNFTIRYLLNDYSVKNSIPWIYGGAVGASGMTATFIPGKTACYRCLFPEPPPPGTADTCETAGVISPIVDTIASIQAVEALKLLTGNSDALHGSLLQIDLWNPSWLPIKLAEARKASCPACANRQFEFLDRDEQDSTAALLCGRNSVHISPNRPTNIALEQLAQRLQATGQVELNPYLLRLLLDSGISLVLFGDGRAIIQGTDSITKARAVYAELLGT